jgi:peptidoglycan/xylan/chitin deacetylase (PgdA/CDA1 family)
MFNRLRLFPVFCFIIALFISMLASLPLVGLAFGDNPVIPPPPEQDEPPLADQKADTIVPYSILDDSNAVIQPGNIPLYDKFTVEERRANKLNLRLPPITPYYAEKVVYLTFDDGPDPVNTPSVLAILRDNQVKGTFFVVGTQIEKHPEILQRIYQEGHAIGNHSYNHIYRDLYRSVDSYTKQLHRTDNLIKNILGCRPRISRAPGGSSGSFTKAYWDKLEEEGYVEVGWNISSGDASASKASQIIANVTAQLNQPFLWNHAIILMHDGAGHQETVKALPHLIKLLKERGFEFRVINAETPPAW